MKLLIAIPAFNEEGSVLSTLKSILEVKISKNVDIVLVNDGSKDRTSDLVKNMYSEVKIINSLQNQGLAAVFNSIMKYSEKNNYDYLVIFDADGQYPSQDIVHFVEYCRANKLDILIGTRNFSDINHFSLFKKFLQIFGSFVVSKYISLKISDVTSGFRIYSKNCFGELYCFNDFTYTIETLFQASSKNLIIGNKPLSKISETRESRLFRTNFEYVSKSLRIIFKSALIYNKKVVNYLFLFFLTPGFYLVSRFFTRYISEGNNPGNIQSLTVGSVYLIMIFITFVIIKTHISQILLGRDLLKNTALPKHE